MTHFRTGAACALAFAAFAAQAQTAPPPISIYGRLDVGVGRYTKATSTDVISGFNTPSVFGVRGYKQVGDGLTGKFALETNNIEADGTMAGRFWGRAAWAGLAGSLGELRVGRIASVAFQTALGYDLNGASSSSAYINTGLSPLFINNLGSRRDRQIQYVSPVMGGLRVLAGHTPKDSAGNTNTKPLSSLAVNYAQGGFGAAFGAESASKIATSFDAADKAPFWAATSYDFGAAKVSVHYVRAGTNPLFGTTNKGAGIGVAVPVRGVNLGFQQVKNIGSGISATELFADKEIFKSATGYINYGRTGESKELQAGGRIASDDYFSVGVVYTF